MLAKDFLEQIEKDDNRIQNKLVELYQLRCLASGIGSLSTDDRVQSSPEGDRLGKIIAKIVDAEKEINELIDNLIVEKQKRIDIIEQIQSESNLQYIVLHKHYVQYKSFTNIAKEEGYSDVWILKVHSEGLKNVQNILNCIC